MNIRQKFNLTDEREEKLSQYVNDLIYKYGPNFNVAETLFSIIENKELDSNEKVIVAYMYGIMIGPDILDSIIGEGTGYNAY